MERKDKRIILIAVGVCLFLAAVDQTIITTALPSVIHQIGGLNDVSLIITSYLVASVTFVPVYGKLSDVYGRKSMLLLALMFFLLGTILAGLTNTSVQLACARFIQGIGGGGLFVLSFTIAADLAPPRNRGKIQGLFASVFGLASVAGPFFGGLIIEYLDWRWIFYVKIPFSIFSLLIVLVFFEDKEEKKKEELNISSLLMLAILLSSIVLFFNFTLNILVFGIKFNLFALVIILASAFLFLSEKSSSNPLFNIDLKRNNNLKFYLFSSFFTGIILLSVSTFIQIYLQIVINLKPLLAGCFLISLTVGIICASSITGKLISSFGKYKIFPVLGGLMLIIGSLVVVVCIIFENSHFSILLLALFILGLGLGPQLSVVTAAIQNATPQNKIGLVTGTLTTTRQLGGIVGLCFLNFIFSSRLGFFSQNNSQYELGKGGDFTNTPNGLSINGGLEISSLVSESFRNGIALVFLTMALIALVIFLLNLLIKEIPLRDK
jgi:EmrB/QacA subfamily drug resistance transporter